MEILQIHSRIIKYDISNENFAGKIMESDKPSFGLLPYDHVLKSRFLIKNNIYITNVDTDFIFDIELETGIQFEHTQARPTIQDLYDIYLKAKESEAQTILENASIGNIWFRIHINIPDYKRPLETIHEELTKIIFLAYGA